MNSLKQLKNDLVYNYIFEIQNMNIGKRNFAFFSDVILDSVLFNAVKEVTYDINTVINFDDNNIDDDGVSEKIASLPSSLQAPIVMRAAISLLDYFVKSTSISTDIVDIIYSNTQISSIIEGIKISLDQYSSLYKEIIEELKEYAEQNDIELSSTDRTISVN